MNHRERQTEAARFRALNPVLFVSTITLVVLSLANAELVRAVFSPLTNTGQPPISLLFLEFGWWLFAGPLVALIVLWLLSGQFFRRTMVQILLSLSAFAISTGLFGLVFLALHIANTRY